MHRAVKTLCILGVLIFCVKLGKCKVVKRDLMDNISSGIKQASQIFGANSAVDIANLVSRAFATNLQSKESRPPDLNDQETINKKYDPSQLLFTILRMFGMDSGKIRAMAINGMVFIAQMIGNFLTPHPSRLSTDCISQADCPELGNQNRMAREGSPLDWIVSDHKSKLSTIMADTQDNKLSEYLVTAIRSIEKNKDDADCIKLLLCKTAPFVWKMQESVTDSVGSVKKDITNESDISNSGFKFLPDLEEYKRHSLYCKRRYSICNTTAAIL